LRNGIVVKTEYINPISVHVPKHIKPLNHEQLGHYLAGLIDGDGHFNKISQLVIVFNSVDVYLAFYLKEKLGFGNVRKVKNKNAYILVISNQQGVLTILNLINGKLRTEVRFNQVVNNILTNDKYKNMISNFFINSSNNFNNH
jgi:hypothetical protein